MGNKKILIEALKNLNKAKKPVKKKDIIYDKEGQWKYPGQPTRIPSNEITMKGVSFPVLGKGSDGSEQMMYPGMEYTFPGADYVDEYPQMKKGGTKKFSSNLQATNRLFKKNSLFKKSPLSKANPLLKKKNYKGKTYDPSAMYFQDGGSSDNDSSKSIVAKPSWYQEPIVNPAAYVSGFRGGNPNMYNYGFLTTDRGNIVGGGGLGFPKSGIELTGLGVVPTSSDERQYFKGFYDAKISKDINKNINLGLGAGAAITGYPGDNGFVMDPIQLQPNVSLKYKFEDGGPIETELTKKEIQAYRDGGYIVEEITDPSIPTLNTMQKGGTIGYQLGDEIDEATMQKLKKQGYTFEKIK